MKGLRKGLFFLGWLVLAFLMGVVSVFGSALYRYGLDSWAQAVGVILSFGPLLGWIWLAIKGVRLRSKGIIAGAMLFLGTVLIGSFLVSIIARAEWMWVIP